MNIAIIHEALSVYGGAEKVLEEFHAIYPAAPVFVPIYTPDGLPAKFREWDIRPTWMNRLPGAAKHRRQLFFLYPFAMHDVDLDPYDVVLSSSFNFAHNVVTGPNTPHVSYCHSPARFLWDFQSYAKHESLNRLKRGLIISFLPALRALDCSSAQLVDYWIATSRLVQDRIHKYYRRRSAIIPPPVKTADFYIARAPTSYFLMLMRLVGWKRPDIVIEACNALHLPLVVAGDGRELPRLKAMAGPTIEFAGRVDGSTKADLYSNCSAFILPSAEDFGITPLEAMASGRPVIALGRGGALDTIIPGKTGELFPAQTADSLVRVLARFDPDRYDPDFIRRHAERFDSIRFRQRIHSAVEHALQRQRTHSAASAGSEMDYGQIEQESLTH